MLKETYVFPALFYYADDGISITFPDLPGCLPCGKSTEEALKNAREALGLHLWGMEVDNELIPTATPINKLKQSVNQIPILIDVFMPPIRDKINNRFVKKTLSIPSWMNIEAERQGVNFSQVLQNALKEYLHLQ